MNRLLAVPLVLLDCATASAESVTIEPSKDNTLYDEFDHPIHRDRRARWQAARHVELEQAANDARLPGQAGEEAVSGAVAPQRTLVVVPTSAAQTASQVAAALAAAIAADPILSAAGVTAFADGNGGVTTGTVDFGISNDPGLSFARPPVPSLLSLALALLAVGMGMAVWLAARPRAGASE